MNVFLSITNCNSLFKTVAVFLFIITILSCGVSKIDGDSTYKLIFLDEYILDENLKFHNHKVGGLSGIDYKDGKFVLISDHSSNPVIFVSDISIENQTIKSVDFIEANTINCDYIKTFDTESIRFLPNKNQYLISAEGNIYKGQNPLIFQTNEIGSCTKFYDLPNFFNANTTDGPRQNGVFEGLTLDYKKTGFWVINELPLKRDGKPPKLYNTNSPLRLTHYQFDDINPDIQLSYDLDRLIKIPFLPFGVNGATEILQIDEEHLLILERSYSAGHKSKGNRVKIFLVNVAKGINLLNASSFKHNKDYNLQKHLLFDSKLIKKSLEFQFIDNIEGMTFGPDLENGNKSLILVSDNNFNAFGHQINQFLLLKLSKL